MMYTTKKSDTFGKIIDKYQCLLKDLLLDNDLDIIRLFPKQILLVPINNDKEVIIYEHLAKDNDTIGSILSLYNININTLLYFNNFFTLILQENQMLKVRPSTDKDFFANLSY